MLNFYKIDPTSLPLHCSLETLPGVFGMLVDSGIIVSFAFIGFRPSVQICLTANDFFNIIPIRASARFQRRAH